MTNEETRRQWLVFAFIAGAAGLGFLIGRKVGFEVAMKQAGVNVCRNLNTFILPEMSKEAAKEFVEVSERVMKSLK